MRLHQRIGQMKRKPLYCEFEDWWLIYFIGLIANVNDRIMKEILKKFHFTKKERASIQQSRNVNIIMKSLAGQHLRASQIYGILKPLPKEVIYYLRGLTPKALICRRIDRFLKDHLNVKLRINGEDLKKMGLVPGQEIGQVLESVLCLKIDKQISTKQEELNEGSRYLLDPSS